MPTKRKTQPTDAMPPKEVGPTAEPAGTLSPEAQAFRARAMEHVAAEDAAAAAAAASQVAAKRELSGPWAVPQIAEIQADWPTRRQPATLSVALSEEEIVEQAHILTAALNGLDIIKSEAKASADEYKARQEQQQSAINRARTLIDCGSENREVECVWVYETAGLDPEGRVIIDSERRTLVRLDTGEVVRHERIPEEDRQLSLFPEDAGEPAPVDPCEFAGWIADPDPNDPDEFTEEAAQETTTEEEAP